VIAEARMTVLAYFTSFLNICLKKTAQFYEVDNFREDDLNISTRGLMLSYML
jgi:hypothetical protein